MRSRPIDNATIAPTPPSTIADPAATPTYRSPSEPNTATLPTSGNYYLFVGGHPNEPATTANFLRYVDEHFYDDTTFYRTVTPGNQPNNPVKIEVIQGGLDTEAGAGYGPIRLERTSVTMAVPTTTAIRIADNPPATNIHKLISVL